MTTPSPSPDAPQEPVRRSWFTKKRVLLPITFVAGLVVGAAGAGGSEPTEADNASVPTTVDVGAAEEPTEATATAALADPEPAPTTTTAATQGERDAPLSIGEAAQVGDYELAVVAFTPDATAEVMGANMFNDPPGEGEVYALVRVRATYAGDGEGMAVWDLSAGYIGDDGRVYVDHDCMAVEPDGLIDQPQVVAGGTVEGNVCLRLPAAVLGTGAIFVEPLISFDDDAKVWWAES